MILPIFAALVLFLITNMITVAAFAIDKRRSSSGAWRIPESRMLWFAALRGRSGRAIATGTRHASNRSSGGFN